MRPWNLVKTLAAKDGLQNVEIRSCPDNKLFHYYENRWVAVSDDELLYYPDGGYWAGPKMSGYYASLKECEVAARAEISWLASSEH